MEELWDMEQVYSGICELGHQFVNLVSIFHALPPVNRVYLSWFGDTRSRYHNDSGGYPMHWCINGSMLPMH